MTQANTDYSLSIPSSATDRTFSASPVEYNSSTFGDHLNQARTFSYDMLFQPRNSSQRQETSHSSRISTEGNSNDTKHYQNVNSSTSTPGSSTNDQPVEISSRPKPVEANSTKEADKQDETDDTAAANAAGACQKTQSYDSKKPAPSTEESSQSELAEQNVTVDDANHHTIVDSIKAAHGLKPQQEAVSATVDAVLTTAMGTAAKMGTASGDLQIDAEGAVANDETSPANPAKRNTAGTETAITNVATPDTLANEHKPPDAAQTMASESHASSTTTIAAKSKSKPEAAEPADEELRNTVRNEQSAQPNKNDMPQLVNAALDAAKAEPNEAHKEKDGDKGVKPLAAKGEPMAAALARIARNSAAGSSESASGNSDLPAVDPARFLGRVAKAFHTAQDRGGNLLLRLSPPELGALRIELNVKNGVMSASLQTENSHARQLLLEHLPALRDRLAEQHIRIDRFDVDVQRDRQNGQTDTRGSQQQFHQPSDQPAPRRQATTQPTHLLATEQAPSPPIVGDTELNLIV